MQAAGRLPSPTLLGARSGHHTHWTRQSRPGGATGTLKTWEQGGGLLLGTGLTFSGEGQATLEHGWALRRVLSAEGAIGRPTLKL